MSDQTSPIAKVQDRVIRVFISSTFRDMQEERDVLINLETGVGICRSGPSCGPRWISSRTNTASGCVS